MNRLASDLVAGGVAGVVATAPMTLVMVALRPRLPRRDRHALPPQQIMMAASRRAGVRQHVGGSRRRQGVTLVGHFAYGGAVGALFGPLTRLTGLPPAVAGVGYGGVVWCVSYLGLLPAVGLFPPPTRVSPRRSALMIVAHLVWGAALGVLADRGDDASGRGRPDSLPTD